MDAAGPAAGPLLTFLQFCAGALDAALAGLGLLRVFDPADEFVAAERRETLPKRKQSRVRTQRCLKIFSRLVDGAVRKGIHINFPE